MVIMVQDGSHLKGQIHTWPLKNIISNKDKFREKQRQPEFGGNGLGFLGQRPEGASREIDDVIWNQVAPVQEVNIIKLI